MKQLIKRYLRRFPFIKNTVKECILKSGDLIPAPAISTPYFVGKVGSPAGESFYGYHDTSPESPDGKLVVFHELLKENQEIISIVIVMKESGETVASTISRAFNYQLGSRATWLSDNTIAFNDLDEYGRIVSRVYDIQAQMITLSCPLPFYSISRTNKFLCINFEDLRRSGSEYGYPGKTQNGLFINRYDPETHNLETLLTLKHFKDFVSTDEQMPVVNHVLPNPENENFVFILRTFNDDGIRKDQMFFYDFDNRKLKKIRTGNLVSHYTWISEQKILLYGSDESSKEGFFELNLITEKMTPVGVLSNVGGDGHPQYFNGKVVVDSYPNFRGLLGLWICHYDKNTELKQIARIRHRSKFKGASRCDLHPRWSRDGESVYFDSVANGKRELLHLKISN